MEIFSEIIIIFVLILVSGIFSGGEIGIVSVSKAKIKELENKKIKSAKALINLRKEPDKFLIMILIGNNIVNITAAMLTARFTTKHLDDNLLGISAGILTFLILIFGEIIPKTFCREHALKISLFLSPVFLFLRRLLYPFIIIFEKILIIFKSKKLPEKITEGEVLAMVNLGSEKGEIETYEKEFFENILEFSDKLVNEIMTPRAKVIGLNQNLNIREVIEFVAKSTHSRFPVYKENIDNIEGILAVKDLLKYSLDKKSRKLLELDLLPAMKVPSTKKIKNLFDEFQKKRFHFAVVIDEHGKTIGIVTLEDILEEIVGEIEDEFDKIENSIQKVENNVFFVSADLSIDEINKSLNLNLESGNDENWRSLGFYILEKIGEIPSEGQKIEINKNLEFIVSEVENNKIEKVKIFIKED